MMRQNAKALALTTVAFVMCWASVTQATSLRFPSVPTTGLAKISFGRPMLPPIGHTRFCLRYPEDCATAEIDLPHKPITLTPERWIELNKVNEEVNRDIVAVVTPGNGATEEWVISPAAGDCKDYAVTKRHQLLALGWPPGSLLLAEVIVPDGEHHLVLVVRTNDVDLVLDNLKRNIQPAGMTYRQYQWVRIETAENPKLWVRVDVPQAVQTAMLSN
jgi:predicted transglutaminase-like cysteine proteinase